MGKTLPSASLARVEILAESHRQALAELHVARAEMHRLGLEAEPSCGDWRRSMRAIARWEELVGKSHIWQRHIAWLAQRRARIRRAIFSALNEWTAQARTNPATVIPLRNKLLLIRQRHDLQVADQLLVAAYRRLQLVEQPLLDCKRRLARCFNFRGELLQASERVLQLEAELASIKNDLTEARVVFAEKDALETSLRISGQRLALVVMAAARAQLQH